MKLLTQSKAKRFFSNNVNVETKELKKETFCKGDINKIDKSS